MKNIIITLLMFLALTGCSSFEIKNQNIEKSMYSKKEIKEYIVKDIESKNHEVAEDFYNASIYLLKKEINKNEYKIETKSDLSGNMGEEIYFSSLDNISYIKNIKVEKSLNDKKEIIESELESINSGNYLLLTLDSTYDNKKILNINYYRGKLLNLKENDLKISYKTDNDKVEEISIEKMVAPVINTLEIKMNLIVNNKEPYLIYEDQKSLVYIIIEY